MLASPSDLSGHRNVDKSGLSIVPFQQPCIGGHAEGAFGRLRVPKCGHAKPMQAIEQSDQPGRDSLPWAEATSRYVQARGRLAGEISISRTARVLRIGSHTGFPGGRFGGCTDDAVGSIVENLDANH